MLTLLGNLQLECAPAEVSLIKVLHRLLRHGLRLKEDEGKAPGFPVNLSFPIKTSCQILMPTQ